MTRHIVAWHFKECYTTSEKEEMAQSIQQELEGLQDRIPGIITIKVVTNLLDSSTHDLMLDSSFTSEEALAHYQSHPDHLKVATFIRSVVQDRICLDFNF